MAELLVLLLVMAVTALAVAWPLLEREAPPVAAGIGDEEERAVRHRLALEAMRDLEADLRAGLLNEADYLQGRAEAEAHAVATLAPAVPSASPAEEPPRPGAWRRPALLLGAAVAGLVLVGFALPGPIGIAERSVTNRPLADAIAAEDARQAEIERLQQVIAADPTDARAFSDLADAYLAGSSFEDQRRGAAALIVVLSLDPENSSAFRRLITAYINTGAWTEASSALGSYEEVATEDEPDIPFFRGLIALRGDGDEAEAVRQFDRFLELAPHDPRAAMVLSLREQAAGVE